jgi:hypothetical protein
MSLAPPLLMPTPNRLNILSNSSEFLHAVIYSNVCFLLR